MPRTATVLCCILSIYAFSGFVRGDDNLKPQLLRSNAKGERLTAIEGMERESILKEFRFEKTSSSRLSTREDAWQHEDASPISKDFSFDDSSEEEDELEVQSSAAARRETLLRQAAKRATRAHHP